MSEKYAFIEAENATVAADTVCAPSITQMCSWLQVSRSGYYEWRSRPEGAAARRRNELKLLVTRAFEDSDGSSGYRRVAAQLARWGVQAGAELVCRACADAPVTFDPTGAGVSRLTMAEHQRGNQRCVMKT